MIECQISYFDGDDFGLCDRHGAELTAGFPCDPGPYVQKFKSVSGFLKMTERLSLCPVLEGKEICWKSLEEEGKSYSCIILNVRKTSHKRIVRYRSRYEIGTVISIDDIRSFTGWYHEQGDLWRSSVFTGLQYLFEGCLRADDLPDQAVRAMSRLIFHSFPKEFTVWQIFNREPF